MHNLQWGQSQDYPNNVSEQLTHQQSSALLLKHTRRRRHAKCFAPRTNTNTNTAFSSTDVTFCWPTRLPGLLLRAVSASRAHFWTLPQCITFLQSSPAPDDVDMPLQSFNTDRTAVTISSGEHGRTSEGWWESRETVVECHIYFLTGEWIKCCALSLTMSVNCGVFIRQTQITEMHEVLLFSCSTMERRWSSSAQT